MRIIGFFYGFIGAEFFTYAKNMPFVMMIDANM